MKKVVLLVLAIAALTVAGCKDKTEAPKTNAPQEGMPSDATHGGGNPHAGLKPMEVAPGSGHKGTVVTVEQAGQFTYVQVDEKGKKLWVAVPKSDVKKGQVVEFPDAPPMLNYASKALNRTFDSVIFAPGLRVAAQ